MLPGACKYNKTLTCLQILPTVFPVPVSYFFLFTKLLFLCFNLSINILMTLGFYSIYLICIHLVPIHL